ncbi:MAG: hypothetical protein AB7Q97_20945 [Gammaproteobacteria bacterium]
MQALSNPIATDGQRRVEADAIRIFGLPPVQAAVAEMARRYAAHANARIPEQAARIRGAAEAGVFHCTVIAANEDAAAPVIFATELAPHRWMGLEVPDARFAIDNPDNIYRIMPVDPRWSYRVEARFEGARPADFNLTVLSEYFGEKGANATIGYLDYETLQVDADGGFVLTFDSTPANGRPNHVTLAPQARFVFFRESLTDWHGQRAAAMQVSPPPGAISRPRSDAELARRAAELALACNSYFFEKVQLGLYQRGAPNEIVPPIDSGAHGGLVTQIARNLQFALADDEALVLTVDRLGARYFGAQLTDLWTVSYDYSNRLSCLNDFEIAPDADGRCSLVVAPRDPGVLNWLDGGGHRTGGVTLRWQRLPAGTPAASSAVSGRVVKLDHLREAMPPGTRYATPADRARQRNKRAASFAERFSA